MIVESNERAATWKNTVKTNLAKRRKTTILSEGGKIWIQPQGYGDKCSADGAGWPIAIEIWQGRLRLIVFDDINEEEPQIIDLEKSKESCRLEKPV